MWVSTLVLANFSKSRLSRYEKHNLRKLDL